MKSKIPKKKEKIDIGEYLEGLKEYLVDHEVICSQDQIALFDSIKGCTIEETQMAYKVVCRIGVQKMNVSIEFGCCLKHLFKNVWRKDKLLWDDFLKKNGFCKDDQAKYYRDLSQLQQFKKFHRLNYSINKLAKNTKLIVQFLNQKEFENQKLFWIGD